MQRATKNVANRIKKIQLLDTTIHKKVCNVIPDTFMPAESEVTSGEPYDQPAFSFVVIKK